MDNKKIVELLKVLKKIYVCEMIGANESFDLIQEVNIGDLNEFLEENGINTLEILESCYNIKNVLSENFEERGCEKTKKGIKDYFWKFEGIDLSNNEVDGIYEKYFKD